MVFKRSYLMVDVYESADHLGPALVVDIYDPRDGWYAIDFQLVEEEKAKQNFSWLFTIDPFLPELRPIDIDDSIDIKEFCDTLEQTIKEERPVYSFVNPRPLTLNIAVEAAE